MPQPRRAWGALLSGALGLSLVLGAEARGAEPSERVARGEYVFHAAGCRGCHTEREGEAPFLGGGRALKTDFGTFYGPNITPDPEQGIGRWNEGDFVRAIRQGVSPEGYRYYPAFPYPSFTKMTDTDIDALWSYLRTVPPSPRPNRPHELRFPFRWRFLLRFWSWLYFEPGPLPSDGSNGPEQERGRYLVEALGHCGECHTPRNRLGGLKGGMKLAGNPRGPDGEAVPNLTPDTETGLGSWTAADLADLLRIGITRDGDFVGGSMSEVVDNSTSRLTDAGRRAMASYLKSIPPIRNLVSKKEPAERKGTGSEW